MTILTDIQQLLEESGYACIFKKASAEVPNDHLLLVLASAPNTQQQMLEISAHPQSFEDTTNEHSQDAYHLIQFQYVLPVDVSPSTFNQISSCLHFFNRLLHCPGFELDELSDQILFRYAWFIKRKGIDSFLLMQVIGNLQLCINMFSPYIKEIAEGKYTLEDILKKVAELKSPEKNEIKIKRKKIS